MPRKTSQRSAAIAEAKNEGNAPRRSGRAVTKQETTTKEASRSRRSSTAAQTAASVADSKTPRVKGSSQRESASPSDSRSSRTGGETPATRVKSTRRSTGRINYKESDGEEEVSNTKFDDNFESGDDLEESESDEKSKTRGRSRSSKTTPKSAEKSKGTSRSRRGRPIKKKEEEENQTFDVSDDSNEPEEVPIKRGRAAKDKEPAKPTRNRRQRAEITEVKTKAATEDKSRQTRRSGRGSTNKEESPKKRPTRGVQAKRYAEDDDDEIEEISDSKADEDEVVEMKETESRKRKRGASPEEANKRLKDAGDEQDEEQSKEVVTKEEDVIEEEKESVKEEKSVEEPMEIDVPDSPRIPETEEKAEKVEDKGSDMKVEEKVDQTDKEHLEEKMEQESTDEKMEKEETIATPKEQQINTDKEDNVESSTKDESIQSSESDSSKKIELSSSELDDSQNAKETDKGKPIDKPVDEIKIDQPKVEKILEPSSQSPEQKSDKDNVSSAQIPVASETNLEKITDNKVEPPIDTTVKANNETSKDENAVQEEKKTPSVEETTVPLETSIPVAPPKESNTDTALNGAEQSSTTQKSTNEVLNVNTPNVNFDHSENNTPKANGAHNDVQHTNSSIKDQYYVLPGRKYVINSKLNENLRQSVKNSMFGFVSFNLGTPDSDAYLQKDKLLNELSKLDAHVICLQQVAKPFYNAVLEPSLDALGFKSIFSQPQDSLKGMATFYKSSLFRLSGKSDISLRELVEKEIEASPLDSEQKAAVKSHIRRCGSVLFTHFSTVIGTQTITVANVQIPRSDFSSHALQISCLAQEVIRINGGTNKPLLLGGEFNIAENDASYQLLRDGYLSNEMIEELQQRKDVVLPDNKHPSSNLCSCYHSVLDHEFIIPELKTASPDLLWYSSDSLHTVGVLDAVSDKTGDHHLSLKADIAFSI
ncbi:2' like protein [Argiope bruennichi]|uniref:2' like protein n=1 Tax=Argiope bruennichi TaxID=94029 RepID=A0A8T0EQU6_ARGBR|nr:2' like protein [Argiope bruennichi]